MKIKLTLDESFFSEHSARFKTESFF